MTETHNHPPTELPEDVLAAVTDIFSRFGHLESARSGLLGVYRAIAANFEAGGILYICGNGGSFADAMHIKGELAKSFELPHPISDPHVIEQLNTDELGRRLLQELELGLPVIVLGESHSLRSAYENDRDPVLCYAQELNSFVSRLRTGVLLAISTSGNAANCIAAATLARAYGITTISFTGPAGGRLAELADIDWRAPGTPGSAPAIQENQLPLYHALCRMLEIHFFHH